MATTGQNLLTGLGKFVDDYYASTTTSAGVVGGTTVVDTALEAFADNKLVGWWVRVTQSGGTQYQVSRITANASATGTVTVSPPFSAQIASASTYELHKYEPRKKFMALDSARLQAADYVFRLIYDETITTDGYSMEYDIPSTIHRGPSLVFVERAPWSPVITWNFIAVPQCQDGMVDWTAGNAIKSVYTRSNSDRLVPKFGPACTEIQIAASTVGTVTLPIAKLTNGITAAQAAGREVTYAHWVYCRVPSHITLSILDDSGTLASSAAHQGRGWEFLTVNATVTENNATTLSLRITEDSNNAVTFYANNAWFYYGPPGMVSSNFYTEVPVRVRRDDAAQKIILTEALPERRQLRLVGREVLTALGTNVTTQTTTSMEVDETTAEILYSYAAEILFELERVSTQNLPQVVERIKMARDRQPELQMAWQFSLPERHVNSPYMR